MTNGKYDVRRDRREPGILPGPSGRERTHRDDRGHREGRPRPSSLGPEDTKHGAVETRAKPQRLRRPVQQDRDEIDGIIVTLPNFGDERAIADTLPPGQSRRARAGAGHARHPRPDDHPRPARQLLRQDVGVQQPDAVRHSVLAHHAAHRSSRFRFLPPRSRVVRRRLPRGARPAPPAHRRHRRAPGGLQHRPLQREDAGSQRHLRRAHRPLRNPRPHRAHER